MNFKSHLRVGALMLGLSLCGGLLNMAHAAPGKEGKTGKRGEGKRGGMKMMRALNLTDAQKAKLKPIMEAQRDKMKTLREDTTLDRKAKTTRMKAMREEMETKVNAILTPDQREKLAEMKAKMKAERKAGGRDGAGKMGKGKRGGGAQAPAPTL